MCAVIFTFNALIQTLLLVFQYQFLKSRREGSTVMKRRRHSDSDSSEAEPSIIVLSEDSEAEAEQVKHINLSLLLITFFQKQSSNIFLIP